MLPLTITNEQWRETNYVAIDSYTIIHDGNSYMDGLFAIWLRNFESSQGV